MAGVLYAMMREGTCYAAAQKAAVVRLIVDDAFGPAWRIGAMATLRIEHFAVRSDPEDELGVAMRELADRRTPVSRARSEKREHFGRLFPAHRTNGLHGAHASASMEERTTDRTGESTDASGRVLLSTKATA
jgi:hypothetical protein